MERTSPQRTQVILETTHKIDKASVQGGVSRHGDGLTCEGKIVEHTRVNLKMLSLTLERYHNCESLI